MHTQLKPQTSKGDTRQHGGGSAVTIPVPRLTIFDVPAIPSEYRSSFAALMTILRGGAGQESDTDWRDFEFSGIAAGLRWTLAADDAGLNGLAAWRLIPTSRGRVFFVEDLVVDPTRRRQGIAKMLMAHVTGLARELACQYVELDTGAHNAEARAFYESIGLRADAVHYGLALPSSVRGRDAELVGPCEGRSG